MYQLSIMLTISIGEALMVNRICLKTSVHFIGLFIFIMFY